MSLSELKSELHILPLLYGSTLKTFRRNETDIVFFFNLIKMYHVFLPVNYFVIMWL